MAGRVRVVGCFIEFKGKILLLYRKYDRLQGNKWGAVVGKVDDGESNSQAMMREIKEETGYAATIEELEFLGELMNIATYKLKLKQQLKIKLKLDEHQGFKWVTPEECFLMKDTVQGMSDFLKEAGYVYKKF